MTGMCKRFVIASNKVTVQDAVRSFDDEGSSLIVGQRPQ